MINRKKLYWALALMSVLVCVAVAWAGTPRLNIYGARFTDEGADHATPPSGYLDLYVNSDTLYMITDGGTKTAITAGTGDNTLDNAYDQGGAGAGKTITADTGAVTITNTDADAAFLLSVTPTPSVSAATGGIIITSGAHCTQDALEFANSGTGNDIYGTSGSWYITKAGAVVAASGTFTNLYQADIAAAASGNANLNIDAAGTGTITLGASSTGKITTDNQVDLFGNTNIGDSTADTLTITASIDGNVVLDDGVTDSPSFTLTDATNETCAMVKKDNGDTQVTIPSDTDFEIVTGNLAVGNGSPGSAAMDGEDFYVEGDSEFDGTATFDGAIAANSTVSIAGNVTLDDSVGSSPLLSFIDSTDEAAVITKVNSGYLSITTLATDGVSILTGNLVVGAGTPDSTINGVDLYVTGLIEADETIRADGGLDVNELIDVDLNANDEYVNIENTATDYSAGAGMVTVHGDHAGNTNDAPLMRLVYQADGDAQDTFILCEDNSTGAASNGDAQFKVGAGGEVTAAGDINANGNIVGDGATVISGTLEDTEAVAAANNDIAAAESGATYYLNAAGGFQSTLPAPAAGLHFKFVVIAAPSGGDYTVISNATADVIYGLAVVNGATVPGAAEDTITFANGAAAIGDWVEVNSDGTNWYVSGQGAGAGAITLTQAD